MLRPMSRTDHKAARDGWKPYYPWGESHGRANRSARGERRHWPIDALRPLRESLYGCDTGSSHANRFAKQSGGYGETTCRHFPERVPFTEMPGDVTKYRFSDPARVWVETLPSFRAAC